MNLINKLVNSATTFQIDSNFKRIKSGKQLDINNKPYSIKFIDTMILHYQEFEEYEKCQVLKEFKTKMLDHENNYFNPHL